MLRRQRGTLCKTGRLRLRLGNNLCRHGRSVHRCIRAFHGWVAGQKMSKAAQARLGSRRPTLPHQPPRAASLPLLRTGNEGKDEMQQRHRRRAGISERNAGSAVLYPLIYYIRDAWKRPMGDCRFATGIAGGPACKVRWRVVVNVGASPSPDHRTTHDHVD